LALKLTGAAFLTGGNKVTAFKRTMLEITKFMILCVVVFWSFICGWLVALHQI